MNCTMGLITALTSPKITATTKMMPARSREESPPRMLTPGTRSVTTHNATPVSAARSRKFMTSVCRAQQVDVHDPAVPFPCRGADFGDVFAHLPDGAVHEQLVGRAEVGAPPDLGVGRGSQERTFTVEHHHGRPADSLVPQPAAGGDEDGLANIVERDAMPRGERLDGGDPGDHVELEFHVFGDPVQDAQRAV